MTHETLREQDAAEAIMTSAREHFLKYGYEGVSLRRICADVGVSTGALYFSFQNKEDLFDALVRPTYYRLDLLLDTTEAFVLRGEEQNYPEEEYYDFLFRFLLEERDELCLLLERAEGSYYEDCFGWVRDRMSRTIFEYMERESGSVPEAGLSAALADMQCAAIRHLVSAHRESEAMARAAKPLQAFAEKGLAALLSQKGPDG